MQRNRQTTRSIARNLVSRLTANYNATYSTREADLVPAATAHVRTKIRCRTQIQRGKQHKQLFLFTGRDTRSLTARSATLPLLLYASSLGPQQRPYPTLLPLGRSCRLPFSPRSHSRRSHCGSGEPRCNASPGASKQSPTHCRLDLPPFGGSRRLIERERWTF